MSETPSYLQDAKDLLTQDGFATGDIWYHGTSSALLDSINEHGLIRSGDKAMNQAAKKTMATIGNSYTESREPVYLTQSKQLAHYWAAQTVRDRSVRFEGEESPVVLEVKLPENQQTKVRPDVGAATLLIMKGGEKFMAWLESVYQENGAGELSIDLMKADRMDYLKKLGMAYIDEDVPAEFVQLVEA
ncbi:hypothetical protein OLMES_5155 [Oleiphilus messinensis]|uniref:Uncharacterized protein n=1 Tax=Oleiphilus messinensis TaxID=141451 RepID=A0A1Y0IG79_9GAMM|nr:hypothetical protein [Oleiphilus messinensis]ARU59139.1 hypothetical protein OLMES_5155 [Oleiphilus messinensis]